MKIGIISDTHDHVEHIVKCVSILKERKVDLVIHAGDWVAPFTLQYYDGLKVAGVFGNNDGDKYLWTKKSQGKNIEVRGDFFQEEIGGLNFAVYHGTAAELRDALIECEKYDVVVYGHNHKLKVEQVGKTLAINPGTVHGILGIDGRATFIIFDTKTKESEVIDL